MAISVLVADDEVEIAEAFSVFLRDYGYEVFTACDGEEAFKLLTEKKPRFLILDMQMPKLSGEEILKKMGELKLPTQVIISTGRVLDRSEKESIMRRFKIAAFLEKPSTGEDMDYVIQSLLKESGA